MTPQCCVHVQNKLNGKTEQLIIKSQLNLQQTKSKSQQYLVSRYLKGVLGYEDHVLLSRKITNQLTEQLIKHHMPKNYSSKGKGKTNYNLLQNNFTNRFTYPSSLINKIKNLQDSKLPYYKERDCKNLHIANDWASLVQQQAREPDDQISCSVSSADIPKLSSDAIPKLK